MLGLLTWELGDGGEGLEPPPLLCMSHYFGSVESGLCKTFIKDAGFPACGDAGRTVKPLAGSALVRAISFECFSAETVRSHVMA